MHRLWEILNFGVPFGRFRGIAIRIHLSLILYLVVRAAQEGYEVGYWGYALAYLVGLYFCILLHEFGHAFGARWCDGEADHILLWPLGGLAYTRPAFHPTAHLVTTIAGPAVTLLLWGFFSILGWALRPSLVGSDRLTLVLFWFVMEMADANRWLLIFNLIPAFPMDGGRVLRDLLWRRKRFYDATSIAATVGKIVALIGGAWGLFTRDFWLILLAVFVWMQGEYEKQLASEELWRTDDFSLRERLARGRRGWSHGRSRRRAEGDEFHASRPGVAFNHPYRTFEEEQAQRRPAKKKGVLGRMFSPSTGSAAVEYEDNEEYIRKEIDPILDKIAKQGMQSLTRRERKILEEAKEKMNRRR